jgi:hypothetical protein
MQRPAITRRRARPRGRPGIPVTPVIRVLPVLRVWCAPVGALAAALLSFWTGGVHLAALAVLAALYLVSVLRGGLARDPLGLLAGFLAPAIAVGVLTLSPLGALEGLLWGGFVRLFLLEQARA